MWAKNAWSFSLLTHWTIEVSINKKAGAGFKGGVFNGITDIGPLVRDNGVQWCSLRQRIQLGADEYLTANG